jgi:integrase
MAITLRSKSQWWYAEISVNGVRRVFRLGVKVEGQRPKTLRELGDARFEASRRQALGEFAKLEQEIVLPQRDSTRLARIHEAKTGVLVERAPISTLPRLWLEKSRNRRPSAHHIAIATTKLNRFVSYLQQSHPRVTDLTVVSTAMVMDYMSHLESTGITQATYNRHLACIHAAFEAVRVRYSLPLNPVSAIRKRLEETVHRVPFTNEQVARILVVAKDDCIAGPPSIVALNTGLRLSDCVGLKWCSVNLESGWILTKAHKNGAAVRIPILPPLRELLERTPVAGEYCFPQSREAFRKSTLHGALRKLLATAGINYDETDETDSPRLHRPSRHGFHAMKTTFVTQALMGGIPSDLLKKVVGNSCADVVQRHYFHPSDDAIKKAFLESMPSFLTMGENGKQRLEASTKLRELRAALESAATSDFLSNRESWLRLIDEISRKLAA